LKANHKVSVVLLTRNSAATVPRALESIFNQTRIPDEVVVVDGNSKDGTLSIVKQFPVKIVTEPGAGFGHARNVGVDNAAEDLVFFIDSDCYAEPNWIEKILSHFDRAEITGVTGQTRLWNKDRGVARALPCKDRSFSKLCPWRYLQNSKASGARVKHFLDFNFFQNSFLVFR